MGKVAERIQQALDYRVPPLPQLPGMHVQPRYIIDHSDLTALVKEALGDKPASEPAVGDVRAVSSNGKRWRIIPADGDWEMQPVGHITAGQAEALCKRIEAALSSPAAPAPKITDAMVIAAFEALPLAAKHVVWGDDLKLALAAALSASEPAGGCVREAVAELDRMYAALAASPLGMTSRWESKPSGGKPYLSGGQRGTLAYGTIGTWDEIAFVAALVNAWPTISAALAPATKPEGEPS